MKPLFVLDDAIVWKVKTDAYWVEVQKSYDLETWETILIHGEEPPYHYVGTRKYDDDHSIFYRTIPADFESQPQ